MSALSPKVGEVLNVTTFTHVAGNMQLTFKRPGRKHTWVFLYLGTEEKGYPLDLVGRMADLGWVPKEETDDRDRA